ncbi:hypothetical protein Q8F55_003824 [Vanrija albida]|uniref:Uncharacterized protein n=1 Tax=Vanrija albida TaxID=181172 RepID=A0ABR3Q513_9TREE
MYGDESSSETLLTTGTRWIFGSNQPVTHGRLTDGNLEYLLREKPRLKAKAPGTDDDDGLHENEGEACPPPAKKTRSSTRHRNSHEEDLDEDLDDNGSPEKQELKSKLCALRKDDLLKLGRQHHIAANFKQANGKWAPKTKDMLVNNIMRLHAAQGVLDLSKVKRHTSKPMSSRHEAALATSTHRSPTPGDRGFYATKNKTELLTLCKAANIPFLNGMGTYESVTVLVDRLASYHSAAGAPTD